MYGCLQSSTIVYIVTWHIKNWLMFLANGFVLRDVKHSKAFAGARWYTSPFPASIFPELLTQNMVSWAPLLILSFQICICNSSSNECPILSTSASFWKRVDCRDVRKSDLITDFHIPRCNHEHGLPNVESWCRWNAAMIDEPWKQIYSTEKYWLLKARFFLYCTPVAYNFTKSANWRSQLGRSSCNSVAPCSDFLSWYCSGQYMYIGGRPGVTEKSPYSFL